MNFSFMFDLVKIYEVKCMKSLYRNLRNRLGGGGYFLFDECLCDGCLCFMFEIQVFGNNNICQMFVYVYICIVFGFMVVINVNVIIFIVYANKFRELVVIIICLILCFFLEL